MKAAKVRALLESILIVEDNSVFKDLLTQQCGAAFELDDINGSRQDLQQMTHAPE